MYDNEELSRQLCIRVPGGFFDGNPHYASLCQECVECEEKCPESFPILRHRGEVGNYFGK
jgi:predicted aldo/keto reductase-like oxidoreductase